MIELKDIGEKVEKIANELTTKLGEAEAERKTLGETTKATKDAVDKLEQKLAELNTKIERNAIPTDGNHKERKTIGQQFIESKAYKDMVAGGGYSSAPFEVKDIIGSRFIDTAGGLPVLPEIIPGVIQEPQVELRIANLIPQVGTTSNSVYFVRGTYTTAAVPKKESKKDALVDKPEAVFTFEPDAETIKTIPVWIPATRQILSDAPALRGLIDNNLMYDVELQKEYQILFGNGTDPNLNGICPQATAYDDTLPTQLGVTTPTRIDHLRAAVYQARLARYPVTGIVVNPFDWAAIELAKDSQERYIWVNVGEGGTPRLWRVDIIESDQMPAGHFLAGAFRQGATLYNREGATIRISESHASYFIENLVAILCELRCAIVVTRPQAFIYGEFEPYGS